MMNAFRRIFGAGSEESAAQGPVPQGPAPQRPVSQGPAPQSSAPQNPAPQSTAPQRPPPEPEPEEITVPEMSVDELRRAPGEGQDVTVLDVREVYEWNAGHLPLDAGWKVLHIPMNSLPDHLDQLPADSTIAVLCAHGNRSYAVTHFLVENGFHARNITGGIAQWARSQGPVIRER